MARHHYLGNAQPPGESVYQVAFWGRAPVALLIWASAALHNAPRDAWIGWNAERKARRLHLVAMNVRFLMLPDAAPHVRNLASRVLSASLRRISDDFMALYAHPILLAETFVDFSRFQGTCYRASNWIFAGESSGWSRKGTVWWKHGRKKGVFLFPLHRRARQWLEAKDSPVDAFGHRGGTKMLDLDKVPIEGEDGILEVLARITDPRDPRGRRHSLMSILAMGIVAVLSGARGVSAIAQYAEEMEGELRKRLGGSPWRAPDESTFRRVFARIDAEELDREVGAWMTRHVEVASQGVALDGKTIRGSRDGDRPGVHLVSAVMHGDGSVIAQTRVDEKTNEIKSVKPLLDDVNIEGAVVTGDAMFAQRAVAEYLVEEKGADYVFTVKDNQPTLRADIENMCLESFSPSGRRED